MPANKELLTTLWSLKEDAMHAWKLALTGDESGLGRVVEDIQLLEQVLRRNQHYDQNSDSEK